MIVLDVLNDYSIARRITISTTRKMRYECCMWSDWGGPLLVKNITSQVVEKWRQEAYKAGVAVRTIESIISTICGLCRFSGHAVDAGRPLFHRPRPPKVLTLDEFDRLLLASPLGWRRWLAVQFVTGLRLADLERLAPPSDCEEIRLDASKTGKLHAFPIPAPVSRLCDGSPLRLPRKRLWRELTELCEAARIPRQGPQLLRALSATEWERARPGCGAVILGHALPGWSSATRYYLDPGQQLRLGLPNLRFPASLLTADERQRQADRERELVTAFRALPENQKETAVSVLTAMVR